MQQFIVAWVEIEINRLTRNNKLNKIRVENVTESIEEYMLVQFHFDDNIVSIPYAYWEIMDFSRALGKMVEFVLEKYHGSVKIEKAPNKSVYDFYLPKES